MVFWGGGFSVYCTMQTWHGMRSEFMSSDGGFWTVEGGGRVMGREKGKIEELKNLH